MAINEALVLDSLALNDGTTFTLEALDMTPPNAREEFISGADSDGAILSREPKFDNREITAQIRVEPQSTMNLALAKIALIVDKLQEARRQANGLALTWVPANSTLATVTFRCLSGQVTQMPIDVQNGWFVNAPLLSVKMTCLPFWEGPEAQVATVTSGAPIIVLPDITALAGDVPALGRLVVLDAASKDRRTVMWGLESRYYPTTSPPSLIVDSASMVTAGFGGTTQSRTAAYSGATNNVISATLQTQPQAVCGLGNLSHVGSFRPQLRFYATHQDMYVRLVFQALDGPFRELAYKVPAVLGFNHVDMGLITIPEVQSGGGTQRWTGRIEAYRGPTGAGAQIDIDAVWMMPAELFGRARAVYADRTGALVAVDQFTGTTAGTVLNARVAPVGGTWATSGSATDFAAADAPSAADETQRRSTVTDSGDRYAILGPASYTNIEVGVEFRTSLFAPIVAAQVIARWTDASNFLALYVDGQSAKLQMINAGAFTAKTIPLPLAPNAFYRLRLIVFASGQAYATVNGQTLKFASTALATGGTLATGKVGFGDTNLSGFAVSRYYDNFYAAVPPPEPIVCYSAQTIEFRHNATIREDSTGVYYGDPPEYVGARFKIPNAGGPARETRIAVIARRNDVESAADDDLVSNATTDSTTVTAYATPRGLVVPR